MSTSTPTPGDDRQRWEMSPEEKLIAQWEAQHDVAARGSRCDPLGLQHQLSRERLAERTRPPAPRATGATASRVAAESAAEGEQHPEPPTARRHPWRRFHRHPSEH